MNGIASPTRRPIPLALAFMVAQAVVVAVLLGPVWRQEWWRGFRGYFDNDQLSYAAIASNVASGTLGLVEPFTLTGSLYYPSLWYQAIGMIALATGLPVYLAWTAAGLLVVGSAVAFVGWAAYRCSGLWFAPVLPAAALLTGTFSWSVAGDWYTPVGSHAVLWGPYGTLFTLNAEAAGLSLAAIAISSLLLAARPRRSMTQRRRAVMVLAAAALLGLLANIQTYSFFTGVLIAAVFAAAWSVQRYRSFGWLAGALVGVGVALLAAPAIATVTGPLPVYGILLLAILPAAIPLVRAHPRLAVSAGAISAAFASPQVARTMVGLAQGDPFLAYRQASTEGLGVPLGAGLLGALPLLLVGLVCAVAMRGRKQFALVSLLTALGAGWILMAANDRWGFDQEPYRFWLQFEVLSALLLAVALAWALAEARRMALPRLVAVVALGAAAAVTWSASVADLPGFWRFADGAGVVVADDDRARAIRGLLGGHDGLVASSQCLDPRVLKLIWPGPVAFYNAGLAWPQDEPAFRTFQDEGRRSTERPDALRAAGVEYVMTDSACPSDWRFGSDQSVVAFATQDYAGPGGPGRLTLWFVQPG